MTRSYSHLSKLISSTGSKSSIAVASMQVKYLPWVSPLQDHLVLTAWEPWEQVITLAAKVDKSVSSTDQIFYMF